MSEPKIHSHITDELPQNHPLAFSCIYCDSLNCLSREGSAMLHASNNECMQTWVESGIGNYCIRCFVNLKFDDINKKHLENMDKDWVVEIEQFFNKRPGDYGFPEVFYGFLAVDEF